jgi:hypothetical protein
MVKALRVFVAGLCIAVAVACGSDSKSPSAPTTPPTSTTLTAPSASAPADGLQLTSLRPTLTVTNGTSAGTRTYEFQLSDRSDFSPAAGAVVSSYYPVTVTKTGVAEGGGTTSFTVEADLQPATRLFWRARILDAGTTASAWSATRSFLTQIVGYNRPGELYDPLVNGETVAELRFKRTTFVAGRGLRIEDSDSYARYRLQQNVSNGEFSLDVEGLSDRPVSENSDTGKLKILSMSDSPSSVYASKWLMNAQYRGLNGNPDNAISFKMLLGDADDDHKLEPDFGSRLAGVRHLNPAATYFWKATWGNFIRVVVQEGAVGAGGSGSGEGGPTIYDLSQSTPFTYNPPTHYAYLGINDSVPETGSWPNVIYRNVWIGNKARPTSLGSALRPQ